ncbi:histidinolphosphatase [Ascosphaera acerosa]|nr:histidinolphosphatase [Ascosphaera acerosa]
MPFSHHSHSGQFCGHARDQLEDCVRAAIARGMRTFCLTEHMPREEGHLYPEELERGVTPADLATTFKAYFATAQALREKYKSRINLSIGFEGEWISDASSPAASSFPCLPMIQAALQSHPADFFIGSIHHTCGVPIDFDRAEYERARKAAGGSDEALFAAYYDEQYAMLQALRPPVVGHFDLVRLFSDAPDEPLRGKGAIWARAQRNLAFVAGYGGLLEVNSAALRKGMAEPYPQADVCREFLRLGGRFCLSDDSHGTAQIGLNYRRVLAYLEAVGVGEVYYLVHVPSSGIQEAQGEAYETLDERFPDTAVRRCELAALRQEQFWDRCEAGKDRVPPSQ